MQDVFEALFQSIENNEPCILASVVHTQGSTPQKAGAKLLIRKDGSATGNLGGGCMEGEIWSLATQILRKRGEPLFRTYKLNGEFAARDGLVCGGTMYFFLGPIFNLKDMKPFVQNILHAYQGGPPVSIATVVNAPGERNNIGKKLLIMKDGSTRGSFENKELEREIVTLGKSTLSNQTNRFYQSTDTAIFIEGFSMPPTLLLIGGGHVNRAVSRLAATLGFNIRVVDDRFEYANKERFPEAEVNVISDYCNALENVSDNPNTYIVIATRGHRYDDLALAAAMKIPARYIGLLGSKQKIITIYKNLLHNHVPLDRIQEIRAPVGLNIGALTPEELAISIMSEIIMIRNGGDGKPLKMDVKEGNTK